MSQPITKPVALITGGARRIGAQISNALHARGIDVVVHYRNSGVEARTLCEQLNQQRQSSARCIKADLLDDSVSPKLIKQLDDWRPRLSYLVNNASSFYPTPLGSIDSAAINDLLGSNLVAPLLLAQAAAATISANQGCIINVVDVYADRPLAQHAVYCAAKAGLASVTKSLALELAPDVRVNGIAPGAILWPENPDHPLSKADLLEQIPLQRLGQAQDIADLTCFLALDAPYITGQVIAVDGGRSLVL